jgi:hypothetical protein
MRHFAKLCLDAEVQAGVRLKLAISCHGKESDKSERYLDHFIYACLEVEFFLVINHFFEANHTTSNGTIEPPIWLYVQSMNIKATASPIGIPRNGRQLYTSKSKVVASKAALLTPRRCHSLKISRIAGQLSQYGEG